MPERALIEDIYAAPLNRDRPWLDFLEAYRIALSSPSAQLMIAARRPGAPRGSIDQLEPGHAAVQTAYYARFEADNPIRYEMLPEGETVSLYDCTSRSRFERSRFYRAFARDNHVEFALATHIGEFGGVAVWLNTSRGGTRDYSESERRLTARLAPHLRRALHFDPTIAALRSPKNRLVVDAAGRVVCAASVNRDARLTFDDRKERVRFLERLADAQVSGHARAMRALLGGVSVELLIRPLPSAYRALCMVDLVTSDGPVLSAPLLADLYGLTPSEAEVARLLALGQDTAAIAQGRGLSPASVRTYFKRIFEKTGVARQSELVALIYRGAAGHA
ncbi:MAG: LuxR C-terminal-related transcriptional regulator [Rhizorhabdus sp.]